jgi:hypothetical protein
MSDGSRKFIADLPGAAVTDFITDGVTEAWIDFTLEGEHFTVNNQLGEFWFFVRNPGARHCGQLLLRS